MRTTFTEQEIIEFFHKTSHVLQADMMLLDVNHKPTEDNPVPNYDLSGGINKVLQIGFDQGTINGKLEAYKEIMKFFDFN